MQDPRQLKLKTALLVVVIALLPLCARAQVPAATTAAASDPSVERGIKLLERGDMKGAAKEFRAAVKRTKDDPVLWLYLGRALVAFGDLKEARKALDASLRLWPDYADAHASLAYLFLFSDKPGDAEAEAKRALASAPDSLDAHYVIGQLRLREGAWLKALAEAELIIARSPNAAAAYSLKAEALLGLYERGNVVLADERRGVYKYDEKTIAEARAAQPLRLREAADSFERSVNLNPNAPGIAEMREQLETLRYYADAAASPNPLLRIYTGSETMTKAVITAKPEPSFTEEARRASISGIVRLHAVLKADGSISHILVVKSLPLGLTQRAIEAARGIRFKPATVNGHAVSQYVTLEYNFNVY
jgi:TonB family protein